MNLKIGKDIELAKRILQKGGLVAIPTETVYGLAANALNEDAVINIFKAKKRPLFDPLIMHFASFNQVEKYCNEIPDKARLLAKQFSPGPITFLLPKKINVPDLITSGLPKVAVRLPNHPLTLNLLNQIDFPLAAPSANPFGYISPTTAGHVFKQLENELDYILDGGECSVGIESTIVEFENDKIIVHRLGGLSVEQLQQFGETELRLNQSSNPSAPGKLKSHYAPRKPLIIGDVNELLEEFKNKKTAVLSFQKKYTSANLILSENGDFSEAAKNLFSYLRELDESEAEIIISEYLPDTFLGKAINDRLKRAASVSE
jgi:L-threonylcarbamoyladenylate synthase